MFAVAEWRLAPVVNGTNRANFVVSLVRLRIPAAVLARGNAVTSPCDHDWRWPRLSFQFSAAACHRKMLEATPHSGNHLRRVY